jgi:hypothetical protein
VWLGAKQPERGEGRKSMASDGRLKSNEGMMETKKNGGVVDFDAG